MPVLAHRLILAPEARSASGLGGRGRRSATRSRRRRSRSRAADRRAAALALALGSATYIAAWAVRRRAAATRSRSGLAARGARRCALGAARGAARWAAPRRPRGERARRGRRRAGRLDAELEPRRPRRRRSSCVERIGRLGEHARQLAVERGAPTGALRPRRHVPRGRYRFEERARSRSRIRSRSSVPRRGLADGGALLVYPRLVELDSLFSETGAHAQRRAPAAAAPADAASTCTACASTSRASRCAGCTGRRPRGAAQLMVKELEDAPRDEVARRARRAASAPPSRPSFDVQVRAAGSILRAYARRGRRARARRQRRGRRAYHARRSDGDWRRALELLAAVEPDRRRSLAALLAAEPGRRRARSSSSVVTPRSSPRLVDRLIQRAASGKPHARLRRRRRRFARPPAATATPAAAAAPGRRRRRRRRASGRRSRRRARRRTSRGGGACARTARSLAAARARRRSTGSGSRIRAERRAAVRARCCSSRSRRRCCAPHWLRLAGVAARGAAGDRRGRLSPLDARARGRRPFFGPLGSTRPAAASSTSTRSVCRSTPAPSPQMHGSSSSRSSLSPRCSRSRSPHGRVLRRGRRRRSGAGWPATLLVGGGDLARGAVILAGCSVRPGGAAAGARLRAAGASSRGAVLVAAARASTSPAVARGSVLDWQSWDPYDAARQPGRRRLRLGRATTTASGSRTRRRPSSRSRRRDDARYWRATTLDAFDGDALGRVADGQLAERQRRTRSCCWTTHAARAARRPRLARAARSIVKALTRRPPRRGRDARRLRPRASRSALPAGRRRDPPAGSSAASVHRLELRAAAEAAGARAGSGPDYPPASSDLPRRVGRRDGRAVRDTRPRDCAIHEPVRDRPRRQPPTRRSTGRARASRRRGAEPRTRQSSRSRRGSGRGRLHATTEQPPRSTGVPPLVGFVIDTKAGYCQHFAGAMALMLRYLGIPARVAAGFTSGRYEPGPRALDRHRPRRARVGRGLVPGLRLAALRSDAGPRELLTRPYSRVARASTRGAARDGARGRRRARARGILRLARQRNRPPGGRRGRSARRARPSAVERSASGRSALAGCSLLAASSSSLRSRSRSGCGGARATCPRDPRRVAAACRRELDGAGSPTRAVRVPAAATPRRGGGDLPRTARRRRTRPLARGDHGRPLRRRRATQARPRPARAARAARAAPRSCGDACRSRARVRGLVSLRSLGLERVTRRPS